MHINWKKWRRYIKGVTGIEALHPSLEMHSEPIEKPHPKAGLPEPKLDAS